MSKKPLKLSDAISDIFNVDKMSPGLKRGMILSLAPAHIKKATNNTSLVSRVKKIKFQGTTLLIIVSDSITKFELTQYRSVIKKSLNSRIKSDMITEVRILSFSGR